MLRFGFAVSLVSIFGAGQAEAQVCSEFVGTTVAAKTFDDAISGLGNVSTKGEFETTAQYQARIGSAGANGSLIIAKQPEGAQYFAYDPDRQLLFVKKYAFDNTNMDWWSAFYEAKPIGITASTIYNRAVVISQRDKPTGSYVAQNGFGAKATVTKITRTVTSIFEAEGSYNDSELFQSASVDVLGTIPMDIPTAQRSKPQLKIAFVVTPKAPYLVQGSHSVGKTTVSNPTDVTENFKILIADFHCGLLMDGSGKVLAAYPMK